MYRQTPAPCSHACAALDPGRTEDVYDTRSTTGADTGSVSAIGGCVRPVVAGAASGRSSRGLRQVDRRGGYFRPIAAHSASYRVVQMSSTV